MIVGSDVVAWIVAVGAAVFVVVVVIGLHVWGAILDGRDEAERRRGPGRRP